VLPLLTSALWPSSANAYARDQLPERVLQFGSGMLLRALCAAAVDSANRAGAHAGRIVVVPSTAQGASRARALNAQDGLYTLVERGLSGGARLERVGHHRRDLARGRARDVAARETRVIISNVSKRGSGSTGPSPLD
jgi:tagaturonate reductase